jgi:hypothetical protein
MSVVNSIWKHFFYTSKRNTCLYEREREGEKEVPNKREHVIIQREGETGHGELNVLVELCS